MRQFFQENDLLHNKYLSFSPKFTPMNPDSLRLEKLTKLLVEIGIVMISNGANSTRTSRNLNRIAKPFDLGLESFFSYSAIIITVEHLKTKEKRTIVKKIPHHGVNFSIISEISILSWDVQQQKMTVEQLETEFEKIRKEKSYPDWLKIIGIGITTAALCEVFGGTVTEFFVAFLAGFFGIISRKFFLDRKFNIFVSFFIASFVSTSVVNIFRYFGIHDFHAALSSCVLWTIPGVPLINGFLDTLEGHIVSGSAKLILGGILIFVIALGFYLSLFIFGYGYNI